MIVIFAFVIILLLVVFSIPAIATAVSRNVVQSLDRGPASGSIDQGMVEGRLTRIEEAIDAMSLQIERLSEHQRILLGSEPPRLEEPDPQRTESGQAPR
jgi:hypothetical protein